MDNKKVKGKNKENQPKRVDKDSADSNPLLKLDSRVEFEIETSNILNDIYSYILPGYESFDIDKGNLDVSLLKDSSDIICICRYYEYLSKCQFKYRYIKPLLENGEMTGKEVFMMMRHLLVNRIMLLVPSFETVIQPEIMFKTKIRY